MNNTTTAKAWQEAGGRSKHEPHYLATHAGWAKVGYFRQDWWAVCPEENAGFGLSFCCGPDTTMVPESELLRAFGTMAAADACIAAHGGHLGQLERELQQERLGEEEDDQDEAAWAFDESIDDDRRCGAIA